MALRHGEGERVRENRLGRRLVADGLQALAEQNPRHHPIRLGRDGEAQVLDGADRVAFRPERLTEGKTKQRISGVGGDVPAEDFGTGHAQPFDLADDWRKMTIERPGRRTSIE